MRWIALTLASSNAVADAYLLGAVRNSPCCHSVPIRSSRTEPVAMGNTNDFKVGLTIEFENSVWKVQEFLHVKPGKGSAFVRSKLKNLETGNVLEKTWKAGESFPDAQECLPSLSVPWALSWTGARSLRPGGQGRYAVLIRGWR